MDINLYGLTFSKFIQQFKETYKVDNNTYDYMSLLKDIDYGSYCVLFSTYTNPNEVLNSQITPLVNTITITGNLQQTGGANPIAYLIILLMFVQTATLVLAGPAQVQATETLLTDDPQKWREIMNAPTPKEPKSESYRSKGFFYGFYELTESQKAKFQEDFETWKNNYIRQQIAARAIGERNEEEQQIRTQQMGDITTKIKTNEAAVKSTLQLTQNEQYSQMMIDNLIRKNEEVQKISEQRGLTLSFLGGMAVAGLIAFAITYRRQFARLFTHNNRQPYYQGQEMNLYNQDQYPQLEDDRWGITQYNRGGKTRRRNRKYKKKQSRRRR